MRGHHFCQQDFEKIGYHFLDTLLDYCDAEPAKVSQGVWISRQCNMSVNDPSHRSEQRNDDDLC